MARVNSADPYSFLKNMPSNNPNNFSSLDRDKVNPFKYSVIELTGPVSGRIFLLIEERSDLLERSC